MPPPMTLRRSAFLVLPVALLGLAGCDPQPSLEESQDQRMHEMAGRSYTDQELAQFPAQPGVPLLIPTSRGVRATTVEPNAQDTAEPGDSTLFFQSVPE